MKKSIRLLILVLCVCLGLTALTACNGDRTDGDDVPDGKVRVVFMDGTTELSRSDIDKGGKVEKPQDPTKDGYDFVGWYKTPAYELAFDFDAELQENTTVFAGFRSQAEDNHTWFMLGESATTDLFKAVGWKDCSQGTDAAKIPTELKLEKDATVGNKFTITVNLYKGDQFQIVNTEQGWAGQIGYGYIDPAQYSTDKTSDLYVGELGLGGTAKKANWQVGKSGNYTLTLLVDADGKLTQVKYERNGDAPELAAEFNYFIKGQYVTGWADMLVEYTQFDTVDKVVYTLEIGMKENDEFMFMSTRIGEENPTPASLNVTKFTLATDEKTTAAIEAGKANFKTKAAGTYLFTITENADETLTLAAEKKADAVPEYDYYVKGSMGGDSTWKNRHPMTKGEDGKYSYTAALAENDEFQIVVTAKDGDPSDDADVILKNGVGTKYADKTNISNQINMDGANFKATAADTFTVTIDPVSMRVSITGTKDVVIWTVCLHGAFNGAAWADSQASCEIRTDAENLTGSFTITLAQNDEFGFRTKKNGAAKGWANAATAEGYTFTNNVPAKITGTGNLKVTVAGTYKIDVTITADGNFAACTISEAEAA